MAAQSSDSKAGTAVGLSRGDGGATLTRYLRGFLAVSLATLFATMVIVVFLSPFVYMVSTATKNREQIAQPTGPKVYPATEVTFTYSGPPVTYTYSFTNPLGLLKEQQVVIAEGDQFKMFKVPDEAGNERALAMVAQRPGQSFFIDPDDRDSGLITWVGEWQTLDRYWRFSPAWGNFTQAWREVDFPLVLRNTLAIALVGDVGTLISCTLVAYGFSRFRIPGKNFLFVVLIGTIVLPAQVTLVPTYAFFQRIGWVDTWLPLTVPHFFANAFNVFLLRQYFMTIPKEMDEAAMMDGASPFRTLLSVILPQSIPVITAVFLFHLFWSWNDFFSALIYLPTRRELQPISIAIYIYNAQYFSRPHMIQATALMGLALPLVLFFFAQRVFMQGVVITGVEK